MLIKSVKQTCDSRNTTYIKFCVFLGLNVIDLSSRVTGSLDVRISESFALVLLCLSQ